MNRAILIVICDFLVSAMLAMMTGMVPAHTGGTGVGLDENTTKQLLTELDQSRTELEKIRQRLRETVNNLGLNPEREAELRRISALLAANRLQRDVLTGNTTRVTPSKLQLELEAERETRMALEARIQAQENLLAGARSSLQDARQRIQEHRQDLAINRRELQQARRAVERASSETVELARRNEALSREMVRSRDAQVRERQAHARELEQQRQRQAAELAKQQQSQAAERAAHARELEQQRQRQAAVLAKQQQSQAAERAAHARELEQQRQVQARARAAHARAMIRQQQQHVQAMAARSEAHARELARQSSVHAQELARRNDEFSKERAAHLQQLAAARDETEIQRREAILRQRELKLEQEQRAAVTARLAAVGRQLDSSQGQLSRVQGELRFVQGRAAELAKNDAASKDQIEAQSRQLRVLELQAGEYRVQAAESRRFMQNAVKELARVQRDLNKAQMAQAEIQAANRFAKEVERVLRNVSNHQEISVIDRYSEAVVQLDYAIAEQGMLRVHTTERQFFLPVVDFNGTTLIPGAFTRLTGDSGSLSYDKVLRVDYFLAALSANRTERRRITGNILVNKEHNSLVALEYRWKDRKPLKPLAYNELKLRGLDGLHLFKSSTYGKENSALDKGRCTLSAKPGEYRMFIRNPGRGALAAAPGDIVLSSKGEFVGIVVSMDRKLGAVVALVPPGREWVSASKMIPLYKGVEEKYFASFAAAMRSWINNLKDDRR